MMRSSKAHTFVLRLLAAFVLGQALGVLPAHADELTRGVVAVDIRAASNAQPWLADALQEHLVRELSTYERLKVQRGSANVREHCGADAACSAMFYQGSGADVVFIAIAGTETLWYELHETWTPSKVKEGVLPLAGQSLIGLRQSVLRVFTPVLTPGGLLDQKPYRAQSSALTDLRRSAARFAALDVSLFLAALALFFVLPLLATFLVVRGRRLKPWSWPSSWVALAAVGAISVVQSFDIPAAAAGSEELQWVLGLVGGAAWGAFAVSNLRLLVPALPGLDRVAHREVFRVIRAWLTVCAQRLITLAVYYLPFGAAVVMVSDRFDLSRETTLMVFAPAVGLGARLWLSSWIRALAFYLDGRLVVGEATADNPWHIEVSRYFAGYLRRTGWAVDPDLWDSLLFLPGRQAGLRCYGGGSVPARIVIDEQTLILAMGANEDERSEEEDEVLVPDWTTGLVHAGASGRRGTPKARARDPLTSLTGHQRKQLGQAPTLVGYVRPAPGQTVPLIADTVEDLEVVRLLLAEHYQWSAPDPDEDDDDTDPTDKDFLFGALAYALGQVVRRDSQLATVSLAVQSTAESIAGVRWGYRMLRGIVMAFIGRSPAIVADAYPALHFARHHHLQYLAYRWTGMEDRLTVRAGVDDLERTSASILSDTQARLESSKKAPAGASVFRRRLVWLSHFFAEPLVDRFERRLQWVTSAAVVFTALGGLGFSVYQAILYHPVYVERIAEQERRHRQKLREQEQNEGSVSHGQQ